MIRKEVEKLRGTLLTPEELDVILPIVLASNETNNNLTSLQETEIFIEKWLKENGYTDGCFRAGCKTIIEGHQGRAIDFEYNGNIDELDVDKLAADIAENAIDDRFSVRVSTYDGIGDREFEILYKDVFCVEIWLND